MDKELTRMINVLIALKNNLNLLNHENPAELLKIKLKNKLKQGIN